MRLVLFFHLLLIISGMVLYVTPMNPLSHNRNIRSIQGNAFDPMSSLSMVARSGDRLSRRKRDFQRGFNTL